MKTLYFIICLMVCFGAVAQQPIQRSRWTTNVDGATISGGSLTNLSILGPVNSGGTILRDITTATSETGLHPSIDTPSVYNEWGFTQNSSVAAFLQATSSGVKIWTNSRSLEFSAPLIIGDSTTNAYDFGIGNVPFTINANAATNTRDGIHNGTEIGLQINNYAPNGQAGICFSSPQSGSNGTIVMSPPQSVCVGALGGWAFAAGLGLTFQNANDFLLVQLDSTHDVHMLTTVDKGSRGARPFLSFDLTLQQWHWPADIVGNGTWLDTGYKEAMFLDTKHPTWTLGYSNFNSQPDFRMYANGVAGAGWGTYFQMSTPNHTWSMISAASTSDAFFGAAQGILAFYDFNGTFTHPTLTLDSSTGTIKFGAFLTNDTSGDIGNSGTLHQSGNAFFGGTMIGNGGGLTNIIATNGAYNGIGLSSSVSTTLVYTNNSGTTKRFLLCGEDDITTAATVGTLTVQVTWTNLVGQSTFTPLSTQTTASKIALPFAPTILVVSNTTSVTISTSQVNTTGTATHTLQVALMPW